MARLYGSFLIRWWSLDGGEIRIELEHIQSGARAVAESLAEALDWIDGSLGEQGPSIGRSDGDTGRRGERAR